MEKYDVISIGGGTAGLGASRSAAVAGKRSLLIADGPIGGDCTWTGCVPSKTLLSQSRRGGSFADAMSTVHSTIAQIAAEEDAATLRSEGIDVVEGRGELRGEGRVDVDGTLYSADTIVLGTGARASVPPIPGLSNVEYLTNDTLFELTELPRRLAIIGAGPIGCEMAVAFAGFGSAVTIVDVADRVLSNNEPEASAIIERTMRSAGIHVHTSASVQSVSQDAAGFRLDLGAESVSADALLVATGRTPNTKGLGLEVVGVELDGRGHIVVDNKMQTSVDGIRAAGDVTGLAPFTHSADEQARLAVAHALGSKGKWKYDASSTPAVTFTSPEVASVGLLESEAPKGSKVAYFSLEHVDRAITEGRTDGFIKLIAAPGRLSRHVLGGKLVGATIVADRAGEMIHGPTMAVRLGMYSFRLAQVTVPYPSWTTGVQQAAGMFFRPVSGQEVRAAR